MKRFWAPSPVRTAFRSAGIILLLAIAQAQARTCLVLPFENKTKNANLEWIGESFVEGLSEVLSGPDLHVATRDERAAAFDQLGIPAASILSRATIIKLAETIDADFVIFGQYTLPKPDQLQATAQILEVKSPRLSGDLVHTGPLQDLLTIQEQLGGKLAQRIAVATGGLALAVPPPSAPRVDLGAWENYIRGLQAQNKAQQIKFFREAARLDASFSRPALHLGKLYFQDRDYATAIPWLVKLKPDDTNHLEATFLLGICYFRQEEYAKAEAAFRQVAERVPLGEVYNNLGAVLSRRGRPGAADQFRKASDADPSDPDYQFNLGFWHYKTGQFASAARRFRLALEQRPNDPEARVLLIKALERGGATADAAREREALSRYPAASRLIASEDKVFEGLERIKRNYDELSFRQLESTVASLTEESLSRLPEPKHAESHLERGRELFREQDDSAAAKELAEAVRLNPASAEAHLLLARIHERNGRPADAVREAELSLASQRSVDAHLLLAKIYLEQSKLAEARDEASKALQLEPANMAAHSVLKTVQMRTQQ